MECPDDYCDLWHVYTPRARKPHKCSACRETIRPGTRYTRIKSLFDGRWKTVKQCARCRFVYLALQRAPWMPAGEEPDVYLGCGHTLEAGTMPQLDELCFATQEEIAAIVYGDADAALESLQWPAQAPDFR